MSNSSVVPYRLKKSTSLVSITKVLQVSTALVVVTCTPAFATEHINDPDEIVVTADRSGAAITEAPVFALGIDQDDIAGSGIFSLNELLDRFPTISQGGNFTRSTNLVGCRGFTLLPNGPTPCAFVFDGVQAIDARSAPQSVYAIDNVVVTTGGNGANQTNAVGGTVVVNSKLPGDAFEAEALARTGNGGLFRVQAGVAGPVTDQLGLRVDGFYHTYDGLIDNTFSGEPVDFVDGNYGFRVGGVYAPGDRATIKAKVDYVFFNEGTANFSFVTDNDVDNTPLPGSNRLGVSRGHQLIATLNAQYDLGSVQLLSISGFNRLTERNRQDLDYSNPIDNPSGVFGAGNVAGVSSQFIDAFSQELRISVPDAGLSFLDKADIGAVYHNVEVDFPALFQLDDGSLSDRDFFSPSNPSLEFFSQSRLDKTEIWAVYASAGLDLSYGFRLDGAFRVEGQKVETSDDLSGFSADDSVVTTPFKVTLSYSSGRTVFYATVSSSSRGPVANSSGLPFGDAETARTAEAGFKSGFFDGRLNFSATGYCTRVNDYQIFTLVGPAQFVVNFDKVRMCGGEGSVDFTPTNWLTAYGSFSAVDSRILEAEQRPDLIGNEAPNTIRAAFNFGGTARRQIADDLFIIFNMDAYYQGERFWNEDNTVREDPAFILNAGAGIEIRNIGVSAFVRNAADTEYSENFLGLENTGRLNALGLRAPPRSYGLQVTARF